MFDFQQEIDVADMNYEEAKLANRPETDIWMLQVTVKTSRYSNIADEVGNKSVKILLAYFLLFDKNQCQQWNKSNKP